MQAQRICKNQRTASHTKEIRQALDRKKNEAVTQHAAKAVKLKKDESQIVNISDITAEGELRQHLQTVLINSQKRGLTAYSPQKRVGP